MLNDDKMNLELFMPNEPFDVRELPLRLTGAPKWSSNDEQSAFRAALCQFYGIDRENTDQFGEFLKVFSYSWYSVRHTSWQELANRIHEDLKDQITTG